MGVGTVEDTEVEVMVMAMAMAVLAKEDMVEGAKVKTHMNLPARTENSRQKLVYTLHTNVYSSPLKKK